MCIRCILYIKDHGNDKFLIGSILWFDTFLVFAANFSFSIERADELKIFLNDQHF